MSAILAASPDVVAERHAWAVLATADGVGIAGVIWLVGRLGSAGEVLRIARLPNGPRVLEDEVRRRAPPAAGRGTWRLTRGIAEAIAVAARDGPRLVRRIERLGLRVMTVEDVDYPARLLAIDESPPVLYLWGDPGAMAAEHAVAIVGTRFATEAGLRRATEIAAAVGRLGGVVVSGLAHGIDGAAHEAVVHDRRPTVAVLGSGHARLYPADHRDLARRIVATGGCVISELPPDMPGDRHTFPRRNRVISGLADATVVVEAPPGSGALITAEQALRQGRECFVAPGPVGTRATQGSIEFLREWHGLARIVTSVPALLMDLGFDVEVRPGASPSSLALGATETAILDLVLAGRTTVDDLASMSGLAVSTVLSALTLLEMRRLVVAAYGRYRPGEALLPQTVSKRRGVTRRSPQGASP